jgi:predicted nuclease of predicted toxin-antitoxin system
MKLKLDENLPRDLRATLRRLENDVSTVAEEGLLSQPDPVIGAAAKAESRLLLTLDVEFGDLRKYPPGSHPGIILFRPRSLGALTVGRFVEDFVQNSDLQALAGCVAVVEPKRTRVRRPPAESVEPQPLS